MSPLPPYSFMASIGTTLHFFCGATVQIRPSQLLFELSGSHTIKQTHIHSVEFLRTSDQLVTEVATTQHPTNTQDEYALSGIRTGDPSNQEAADLHLKPHITFTGYK